jgi:hypothetical protein
VVDLGLANTKDIVQCVKVPHRKSLAAVDVPGDNPVGTMQRFTVGLRRLLAAPKTSTKAIQTRHRESRRSVKYIITKRIMEGGSMLNSTLRKSLNLILVVAKALILAILIIWICNLPVRPAY